MFRHLRSLPNTCKGYVLPHITRRFFRYPLSDYLSASKRTELEAIQKPSPQFSAVVTKSTSHLNEAERKTLSAFENEKEAKLKQFYQTARNEPVHVLITGASGQIGYSLVFRVASGQLLGPFQPIILHLLELPQAMKALGGVVMELQDCAFPLVKQIVPTDNLETAFKGVNYGLLVGAKPRTKGMERGDLLKDNAAIFSAQGKALDKYSDRSNLKVVVVGNPANTNAFIAQRNAPNIPATSFSAMTALDHNRGLGQIALKTGCEVSDIERFAIWGNHSATQYPDLSHTLIKGQWAKKMINDEKWITDSFIPTVQKRGAAIIDARGSSSAASAANAVINHIHNWVYGTNDKWFSMAVFSDESYGVTPGIFFSYPVVCSNGQYHIVQNVPIDEFSAQRIEVSHQELIQEKKDVLSFLK